MDDTKDLKNRQVFLILRAQSGDRQAFDRLLETVQDELFGFLVSMLRDSADAEDALQATFIQAFRKLSWLREPTLFRPWMFRIASRMAYRIMNKKRRGKEVSNIESFDDVAITNSLDDSEKQELIERIPEWLDQLTEKCREAVILHYLKGFTADRVADILGIPTGTVKSRISYSLNVIRKHANHRKANQS